MHHTWKAARWQVRQCRREDRSTGARVESFGADAPWQYLSHAPMRGLNFV